MGKPNDSHIISIVNNNNNGNISGNCLRQQPLAVPCFGRPFSSARSQSGDRVGGAKNANASSEGGDNNNFTVNNNNNSHITSRSASDSSDSCGSRTKRNTLGFASSCYKASCKGKTRTGDCGEGKTTRPSATKTTGSSSSSSSASSASSFFAGTVAATDQVLFKLVQRLASLRSNSSAGRAKNSAKGKKKKKNCSDSSEPEAAIQSRRPSGSEVPDKKPRCEDPVAEDRRRPFHRNLYDSCCYDGPDGGNVGESNEAIVEAAAPKSGNYHAQIAPHRKYSQDEDEECRNFDVVVAASGGEANSVCVGKIDCISYGASELILPSPLPGPGQRVGSDCDLVLSESGCDEAYLAEQHDGNNNGIVNCATLIDQHQTTEGIMGANVSRHHEKGLTGRRAQSTDNLKSDQTQSYHQYQYVCGANQNNNNGSKNHIVKSVPPDLTPGSEFIGGGTVCNGSDDCQYQDGSCPNENGINSNDRNKFCGSLPNHLDADDACEAIFKQNEFLQTHLKNVLASHQQQQPEYVSVSGLGSGGGGGSAVPNDGGADGGSTNMNHQPASLVSSQQQQQQQPTMSTYQQSSPFYSSSSGKGSTISSTALGSSTFRSGGCSGDHHRPDIQLKLPLHRTALDTGCDQGYGSERSPEDEMPPPLLLMHEAQYNEILATAGLNQQPPTSVIEPNDLQRFWNYEKAAASLIASGEYSFITKDTVFLVQVPKGTRGLGLSVSGGSDSSAPFPGLIRIKRLFPHQAAWATGMLQPGDILLEANGIPLTGLTNYEALEVLRTAPNYVSLTVCRPQDEQYRKLSPPSEPPKPPLRNALSSEPQSQVQSPQLSGIIGGGAGGGGQLMQFQHMQYNQQQQQMVPYYYQQQQQQQQQYIYAPQTLAYTPLDSIQSSFNGEFEIILTKQQGSLGFTLRKEDESILGHCVRALVRDPALNDGRIKPGDKIMAVNDVPISQMTHEEAVIFLRQAAEVVKLRLYRDQAQTPLSAQSPNLGDRRMDGENLLTKSDSTSTVGGTGKPKPNLRPEALNLLTDIAYRKQSIATNNSGGGSGSTSSSVKSSNASPRRLRRGLPQQQQRTYDNHGYQHSGGETSNYSDSETSTIVSQGGQQMVPGGLFHNGSCRSCGGAGNAMVQENLDESYYCDDEIDIESLYEEEGEQHKRPNFLNLAGESGSTPMSSRKPRFQFSVATANAYELNNLDNDALDAPTMYALNGDPVGTNGAAPGSDQFISLPCETFLVACKTENDLNTDSTDAIYVKHFAHKSPLYSSVNVPLKDTGGNVSEVVDAVEKGGKKSLMKWKGAVLTSDEDDTPSHGYSASLDDGTSPSFSGTGTSDTPESSLAATFGTSTTTPTTERELDFNGCGIDSDGNKIFTVELNKGWNSRLGFSLQQDPDSHQTVVSAIYSESVAAKDGRLRVGDQLLTVNDESVEAMSTAQIINLLRIIRGSICLRLIRRTTGPYSIPEEQESESQPELDFPPPPDDLLTPDCSNNEREVAEEMVCNPLQ